MEIRFVAEQNGKIIGFVIGFVDGISVHKNYVGIGGDRVLFKRKLVK